jgi:hypothetical protein
MDLQLNSIKTKLKNTLYQYLILNHIELKRVRKILKCCTQPIKEKPHISVKLFLVAGTGLPSTPLHFAQDKLLAQ